MILRKNIIGAAVIIIGAIGCNNVENSPGWEYMPDMYRSSSYETNSGNRIFTDSLSNRPAVPGTISQGWVANSDYSMLKMPYPYKNDSAGYEDAGKFLKDPFPASAEVIAEGKDKFEKFCKHCHGASGQGDGAVVEKGGHPGPSPYNSAALKNLPEGKIFHVLEYGKNMMGSHASQLTVEERWKIVRYVQTLQNPGGAAAPAAPADSTARKDGSVTAANKTMNNAGGTAKQDTTAK